MNYFTHALPHLRDPVFIAGTALPDWLSVVNRKVRLRPKALQPFFDHPDPFVSSLVSLHARVCRSHRGTWPPVS
jgi:hypothetical protein